MKLPSFFKIQETCPFIACGNLKTLSFRVENNHNIFNSQRFYNNVDDEIVENVIEDLKKEKERFFYEGGERTSSILEVSSSKNNGDSNTFEFQPFSESSCVTTRMNLKDPFGNSKKSKGKMVEVNQGIEISSIREVGSTSKSDDSSSKGFEFVPLNDSSILMMDSVNPLENSKKSMKEVVESSSKSDYNSSNGLEYLPFNDSSIIALMNSVNPYEDFKKSMKEMLEANQQTTECEKCLEELLIWYLKSNGKANHSFGPETALLPQLRWPKQRSVADLTVRQLAHRSWAARTALRSTTTSIECFGNCMMRRYCVPPDQSRRSITLRQTNSYYLTGKREADERYENNIEGGEQGSVDGDEKNKSNKEEESKSEKEKEDDHQHDDNGSQMGHELISISQDDPVKTFSFDRLGHLKSSPLQKQLMDYLDEVSHSRMFRWLAVKSNTNIKEASLFNPPDNAVMHPWIVPTEEELVMTSYITLSYVDNIADPIVELIKKKLAGATAIRRAVRQGHPNVKTLHDQPTKTIRVLLLVDLLVLVACILMLLPLVMMSMLMLKKE
ncbi:hypothetical protein BC332_32294 [Capsicum chinense]|nr:hypothetical protein BC332_32294 [Capsicum chinense]